MLRPDRIFLRFALVLLPVATFGQLDLGSHLTSAQIPKDNLQCASTPSQTYPCVLGLKVDGVKFNTVGYDSATKRVKYLITSDPRFRTKEGLQVGDWIEISENQVIAYPGWNIYGPRTKDGWHIVVGAALLPDQTVQFQDGTVIYPSGSRTGPPRIGKVQIREFEKGGL